MKTEVKPDWITDKQWETVPYVSWWKDQREGAEYIAQSKPRTVQESMKQFEMLRNSKNWNQGV